MVNYPVWYLSLYIFAFILNLCISVMMFYLRLRGGSERYTKSQLWALTLLAWLFLLNSVLILADTIVMVHSNLGVLGSAWTFQALSLDLTIITAFVLLCFGLVYPRPITDWKRLRWILVLVLAVGVVVVVMDSLFRHSNWLGDFGLDVRVFVYFFAIFIPVFIWLSHYSRSPSRESRMIYTIFIWGYLFVHISRSIWGFFNSDNLNSNAYVGLTVGLMLSALALARMGYAVYGHRKLWSRAETVNLALAFSAVVLGVVTGQAKGFTILGQVMQPTHLQLFFIFLATISGWVFLRPVLFTYGLLRYRLLGSQIKPERALAAMIAVLASSAIALFVLNIGFNVSPPGAIVASLFAGLVLVLPFWRISERFVKQTLPLSATAQEMSLKERRNIYLMGLQGAVVRGEIADPGDKAALGTLKSELGITDREHELLIESIQLHEARILPQKAVEEAFLIHKYGLLIAHYRELERGPQDDSDSDIFAGMFTAITEYVGETMEDEERSAPSSTTDAISYGPTSLVMEKEGHVVLAVMISGADDLELRQLMRDTLADIVERYPSVNKQDWDGNLEGLERLDTLLADFSNRVKRRSD